MQILLPESMHVLHVCMMHPMHMIMCYMANKILSKDCAFHSSDALYNLHHASS